MTVSNVSTGTDSISFDVSEPGTPILVKTSYFPNWQASGADGPWRVTPNLMVVVPTSNHVELHYGYTKVDILGYGVSLLGVVGLVWLWRSGARHHAARAPAPSPAPPRTRRTDPDETDGRHGPPGRRRASSPTEYPRRASTRPR